MKFLGVLSILALCGLASTTNLEILDQDDQPISSIVEQVCWSSSSTVRQISRISTVAKIADYLASLPSDDKLAACSSLYLESVRKLENVLSITTDNVCSPEKITVIHQFHKHYILKGSPLAGKVPKVLSTFFLHYVNYISQLCSAETAGSLDALTIPPETDTSEVDKVLAQLTDNTGVSSSSTLGYSDIFLLWPMIDMLPIRNSVKLEKYLFEGEKRVVVATANPEALLKVQELCRTKARPVYSKSMLASITLIDMGYYPSSTFILRQLNENKNARRFYELTKVCETLLHVRILGQSSSTPESDTVFLTRQEVEELRLSEIHSPPEVPADVCEHCSMAEVDILGSVNVEGGIAVTNRIKSNIKNRRGSVSRLLRTFIKKARSSMMGGLKKLFRGEAVSEIQLPDETKLDIFEVYDEDESSDHNLARPKRGLTNVLKDVLLYFVGVLYFIAYIIWLYIKLIIMIPIGAVCALALSIARCLI